MCPSISTSGGVMLRSIHMEGRVRNDMCIVLTGERVARSRLKRERGEQLTSHPSQSAVKDEFRQGSCRATQRSVFEYSVRLCYCGGGVLPEMKHTLIHKRWPPKSTIHHACTLFALRRGCVATSLTQSYGSIKMIIFQGRPSSIRSHSKLGHALGLLPDL